MAEMVTTGRERNTEARKHKTKHLQLLFELNSNGVAGPAAGDQCADLRGDCAPARRRAVRGRRAWSKAQGAVVVWAASLPTSCQDAVLWRHPRRCTCAQQPPVWEKRRLRRVPAVCPFGTRFRALGSQHCTHMHSVHNCTHCQHLLITSHLSTCCTVQIPEPSAAQEPQGTGGAAVLPAQLHPGPGAAAPPARDRLVCRPPAGWPPSPLPASPPLFSSQPERDPPTLALLGLV